MLPSRISTVDVPECVELHTFDFAEKPWKKRWFLAWLEEFVGIERPDMLITYRCPYIIPERILMHIKEAYNIHPLAVPEFAGLNPWTHFRESGRKSSEAVLHRMRADADSGEIIMTRQYSFSHYHEMRDTADRASALLFERLMKQQ